jgi:hypothetical protein
MLRAICVSLNYILAWAMLRAICVSLNYILAWAMLRGIYQVPELAVSFISMTFQVFSLAFNSDG